MPKTFNIAIIIDMKKIPLILDLDTGIDDAVALIFAHALKNLDLELITTVFGNINIDQVIHNSLVICDDVNCNAKIVKGESLPLKPTNFNVSAHGKNGLGNYTHEVSRTISDENYIEAMHKVIEKNTITNIVSCGPLTNLAKYILAHPEDNDKIRVVLVTGLLENDKENPYLNFNIAKDVEACKVVLKHYKNIVFVPSDMGHLSFISADDFHKTAKCGRVGEILANLYPSHMDRTVKNGAALHDLCGVLWLSHPELFVTNPALTKIKTTKKGSYLDFDYNNPKSNTFVATEIDIEKTHKLYYKTLKELK